MARKVVVCHYPWLARMPGTVVLELMSPALHIDLRDARYSLSIGIVMYTRNAIYDICASHEAISVITTSLHLNCCLDRHLSLLLGVLKTAGFIVKPATWHLSCTNFRDCSWFGQFLRLQYPPPVLKTAWDAFSSFATDWPGQSRRRLVLPRGWWRSRQWATPSSRRCYLQQP